MAKVLQGDFTRKKRTLLKKVLKQTRSRVSAENLRNIFRSAYLASNFSSWFHDLGKPAPSNPGLYGLV